MTVIIESRYYRKRIASVVMIYSCIGLSACGGGSDGVAPGDAADIPATELADASDNMPDTDQTMPEDSEEQAELPSEDSQNESWYGQIIIEQYSYGGPYGAAMLGNFYRFSGDVNQLSEHVSHIPTETECTTFGLADNATALNFNASGAYEEVSAGEIIVLSGANGTIAQMPEIDSNFQQYFIDTPIPAINAITNIQVPGAEFPNLEISNIPTVEPLNITQTVSGNHIGADPLFTWTTTAADDADYLDIRGTAFSESGDAIGYVCITPDNGQFSLPDDIATRFGNSFSPDFINTMRVKSTFNQMGDVSYGVYVFDVAY